MVKTTEFNVQTQMNYIVGNMSGFTAAYTGMDNLSALLSSLMTSYTTMAGTGRAAYLSLGAAISAVGLKSAEAFGEYQRGMNMVKAISNNTNAQMQMLSQSAQQFSGQFRMGIEDINDGLVTLGRAGLTDVNNQIEVLKNGLQVAKISGMDLASTLEDIVTTTSLLGGDIKSNTFGAETKEISNLLVATSLSGPLNVSDVIETLKFAGGSAAAAGATLSNEEGLHDLLGTIGAFSQKGVTGSIAGTALRAFITKPASQDQKVSDALAKLGLDAYSLWEKDPEQGWHMKPIAEQIGMITKAMNDNHLTNLDRIEVWGDIVGNKMGQQMLKLDENRIKETTKDIEHQRNLEDIYQGTLTNFASQVERLNQIFQAIYRNVGSGFASMLTGIVQGFADVLEFLNSIGNGVLFKAIAPILGPLGLYGLAKGLKDFVELLGMLKANIQSSLERPIKGQALYQPYEDWETSRRGGRSGGFSGGIIRSNGTVNITGPTTVQSTGNITPYKSFMNDLSKKYFPQNYINTPEWRTAEEAAKKRLAQTAETANLTRKGNVLSSGSKYDIFMKDPSAYSEADLANLQKYESYNRATRYIGKKLLESGQLLTGDYEFTEEALQIFRKTMNLDKGMMPVIRKFAAKAVEQMARDYKTTPQVDPTDPNKERINPDFANKMVQIVSKRMLSTIFRKDYLEELGPNASFYDFLKRGMDLTLFEEYLNNPLSNFEREVESHRGEEGWEEGGEKYEARKQEVLAQQGWMARLGGFNYLNTTDQTHNVSALAMEAVNRGLEGFELKNGINAKVEEELARTEKTIKADETKFRAAGAELGGSLKNGYVKQGLGIASPGYMYWSTWGEFQRIQDFLLSIGSLLGADGRIAGESIVKAFSSQSWIASGIDPNERYFPNELLRKKGPGNFLALDLETTGTTFGDNLDRNSGILQIGAVRFNGKGQPWNLKEWGYKTGGLDPDNLEKKNAIVRYRMNDQKVENVIEPESQRVNKIDYDNFNKGQFLSEEQELKNFANYIEKVLGRSIQEAIELGQKIKVIAHNGQFDINALSKTIDRVNNELRALGLKTIPDFTKVFSLIDTQDVGREALRDKYGTEPLKGFGRDSSLSLGIGYMQEFDGEEELHFMGNEKQESYGRITGVAKDEIHDAFMDAFQDGQIYVKLENRDLPDGRLMYGPTYLEQSGTPMMLGLEYAKAVSDNQKEWRGGAHKKAIKAFEKLQKTLYAEEASNYEELEKLNSNQSRELTGPGYLDHHAFRFYGPIEENIKRIRDLEKTLGPGLTSFIPRPGNAPIGHEVAGYTPFAFINNLDDDLTHMFSLKEEEIKRREKTLGYAPTSQKGPTSGERVPGAPGTPIGSAKVHFGGPTDESYGSDGVIDKNILGTNLREARLKEFEEIYHASIDDFNNVVSFLKGESLYKAKRDKGNWEYSANRADLEKEGFGEIEKLSPKGAAEYILKRIPHLFNSGLFELAEISPLIPGDVRFAQDEYNKIHIAPDDVFYDYSGLREGFSTPQSLSAQRALNLYAQGFDEMGHLIGPLTTWFREAEAELGYIHENKKLPQTSTAVPPGAVHQALMKLFNASGGDMGMVNFLRNKYLQDNKEKEYLKKYSSTDVQTILEGLGLFNQFGELIGLTGIGEDFYRHYGFSGSENVNLNDLTYKVTSLLDREELAEEFMFGVQLTPQEDNIRGNNREDEVDYYIDDRYTIKDKQNSLVNDILLGRFSELKDVPAMIEYVNKAPGFDVWSIEDDELKLADYHNKSFKSVVQTLTFMEDVFKTNTPGAYYNYNDVDPMSFKTIEDLPVFKEYARMFKNMTGGLEWIVAPELQYNNVRAKMSNYYKKDIEEGYFEEGGAKGKYERVKEGGRIGSMMSQALFPYHDLYPGERTEEQRRIERKESRYEAQRRALNIYDYDFGENPIPAFVSQIQDLPDGIEKYIPIVATIATRLGEAFVINFRNAVGFHSPIKVITDFNDMLKKQLNESAEITELGAEKILMAAKGLKKGIREELMKIGDDETMIAQAYHDSLIPFTQAKNSLDELRHKYAKEKFAPKLNKAYEHVLREQVPIRDDVKRYHELSQIAQFKGDDTYKGMDFQRQFLDAKKIEGKIERREKYYEEKLKAEEDEINLDEQNEKKRLEQQAKAQESYMKSERYLQKQKEIAQENLRKEMGKKQERFQQERNSIMKGRSEYLSEAREKARQATLIKSLGSDLLVVANRMQDDPDVHKQWSKIEERNQRKEAERQRREIERQHIAEHKMLEREQKAIRFREVASFSNSNGMAEGYLKTYSNEEEIEEFHKQVRADRLETSRQNQLQVEAKRRYEEEQREREEQLRKLEEQRERRNRTLRKYPTRQVLSRNMIAKGRGEYLHQGDAIVEESREQWAKARNILNFSREASKGYQRTGFEPLGAVFAKGYIDAGQYNPYEEALADERKRVEDIRKEREEIHKRRSSYLQEARQKSRQRGQELRQRQKELDQEKQVDESYNKFSMASFLETKEMKRIRGLNEAVEKLASRKLVAGSSDHSYDQIMKTISPDSKKHHLGYGHLTAEEFLESKIIKHLDKSTPVDLQKMNKFSSEKKDFHTRMSEAYGRSSLRKGLGISPEQKIQQRNQRAIEKWTQELIKGSMTQEQYAALLEGLTLSGQNFEAELQKANANLLKFSNELLTGTFEDDAAREELIGKIHQEIATIETLNEAKRRETTASIAAAEADRQESVTGRLSGFASAVGGMAGKLANGMFGLMMNPYVMVAQMVWGYVQQGIEMIRQQEEEKISKLSEIASNAESSYDEQTSKWEDAQSKANEKFGDLSDNEKQDQMLEAIQKAREDNNSASAETKALLGKQNALISSSDNMINAKTNQRLTGYKGLQANWEEFMQGSGMVGSKDEFGLMDYLEGLINPDKFKDDSNTARIQAMADATIQIDTRVKNMEEMTEDYQKVMASFGVAGRSMLDIYNVRGILSDNFFSGTFFDPNSSQRIGAPGFRTPEQLASLMKKEEKILQRFENRYLRFTRSTTGQGDRITVTLGEGSIHNLANQLGVKDVEAAQMLAVHELQRIQDVMLNQVEPQLAQTAISMYQGAYSLEQNKNLNDIQAAFQNTMTQGIFAIQAQVAQLVYKATMEQALADYQAATGDTETDTIGLLLNRARDTSYEYHDEAKQFASQGWGGFMQARDLNHLVNQGYTQEQAMNKLLEQGKDSDYYKKLYGEQLGKFEYNSQDGQFSKMLIQSALGPFLGREINEYLDFNNNKYSDFTEYTDWMMKSYAENVPLDEAIKTLNDAQTAADEEGNNGKDTDTSDADKQRYVQLAICNKKAIPKLNVNLFKKAPTFTVLNKNFKLRDIKINTADKAKNIENSLKNAIIDVQERSDPKIIQDSEAEYDPVGATDDATNLPTGASLTK